MTQIDLFDGPSDANNLRGDAPRSVWQRRDFAGYVQFRESCGPYVGPWQFNVTGFNEGRCSVMRADGSIDRHVPIDDLGRILIAGRRYGSKHWSH